MKKKQILVIEDEDSIRTALVDKIVFEGFNALEARDGQEGLKIALKKHPDLILLDIIMPRMDGLTMLKKLREDKWGEGVPVILLTNLNDSEKIFEAMDSGVYDYLVKSNWEIDDVVKKAREKLGL
jgi:DNA-binding response OmpR family regulator